MRIPCFSFASFMAHVTIKEPVFKEVGYTYCNFFVNQLPKNTNSKRFKELMNIPDIGKYALQRGDNIFIIDIEEEEQSVVLHGTLSDEDDDNFIHFVNDYFWLKKKVIEQGGTFHDVRFDK